MTNCAKNKYRNRTVKNELGTFGSVKEAERGAELKILEKAEVISELRFQVPFLLQESFKVGNKTYRKIEYFADAVYVENGQTIVEDTKSFITRTNPVYRMKIKMLMYRYRDIVFRENM